MRPRRDSPPAIATASAVPVATPTSTPAIAEAAPEPTAISHSNKGEKGEAKGGLLFLGRTRFHQSVID